MKVLRFTQTNKNMEYNTNSILEKDLKCMFFYLFFHEIPPIFEKSLKFQLKIDMRVKTSRQNDSVACA